MIVAVLPCLSGAVMEQVSDTWRSVLGITFQVEFSVGFTLWPALAYFVRDDVRLQLVVAFPLLVLVPFWWSVCHSGQHSFFIVR